MQNYVLRLNFIEKFRKNFSHINVLNCEWDNKRKHNDIFPVLLRLENYSFIN